MKSYTQNQSEATTLLLLSIHIKSFKSIQRQISHHAYSGCSYLFNVLHLYVQYCE